MAKMKKCKVCKNLIAKSTTNCPHCGAVYKKRGCLPKIIACIIGAIVVVVLMQKSPEEERNDKIRDQKYAEIERQKKNFEILDESFMQSKSYEIVDEYLSHSQTKTKSNIMSNFYKVKSKENVYIVERGFEIQNAFGVWIKHNSKITFKFTPKQGYKVLEIQIDDEKITL